MADIINRSPSFPVGYDIMRIKKELDGELGQLSPGRTGGLFIRGSVDEAVKEIVVAVVQRVNDHVSYSFYTKIADGHKPEVGFKMQVEWGGD